MASISGELHCKLRRVRSERDRLEESKRLIEFHTRDERAQRLIRRLDDCDSSLAELLSRAMEYVETLDIPDTDKSAFHAASSSLDGLNKKIDTNELQTQAWSTTLDDLLIGLISAAREMQKIKQRSCTDGPSEDDAIAKASSRRTSPTLRHHFSDNSSYSSSTKSPIFSSASDCRCNTSSVATRNPDPESSMMMMDWQRTRSKDDNTNSLCKFFANNLPDMCSSLGERKHQTPECHDAGAKESVPSSYQLRRLKKSELHKTNNLQAITSRQSSRFNHGQASPQNVADHTALKQLHRLRCADQFHSREDSGLLRAITQMHYEVVPASIGRTHATKSDESS